MEGPKLPQQGQEEASAERRRYAIRIQGYLDAGWVDWVEGLTLVHTEAGDTVISIPVADKAALHGILARIGDLNLTLLAVSTCPECS